MFDDVTPLIRTQRVAAWRDVARRLAHEIKNPLTPIQLCAERMHRQFRTAPPAGAGAGRRVHVDDRRRGRVTQGAGRRVRAVRPHAGATRRARRPDGRARRDAGPLQRTLQPHPDGAPLFEGLPRVRVDVEQSGASSSISWTTPWRRSAVLGLVFARTASAVDCDRDPARSGDGVARILVSDNGPGISACRSRQAVHALLLDRGTGQRPRAGYRPAHRRRARRQHRSRRQRAARHGIHH